MHYKQRDPQKKILAVSGSPRKNGNSDTILKQITQGFEEENANYKTLFLRDYDFKSCIGCEACRSHKECIGLKDQMQEIYPDIIDSQGVVWISPAHNYNVTAIMKAFIDRHYTLYNFNNERPRGWSSQLAGQNRKAIVVGIAEQVKKEDMGFTIASMRLCLEALGYDIVDEIAVYGVFEKGKVRNNKEIMDRAKMAGKRLANSLNL